MNEEQFDIRKRQSRLESVVREVDGKLVERILVLPPIGHGDAWVGYGDGARR